jgi:hypothetical protein
MMMIALPGCVEGHLAHLWNTGLFWSGNKRKCLTKQFIVAITELTSSSK